ncbi:Glyoxalase/bleomycin resistance protein/dioxygenase [Pseudooceanicola batsensis HTCC2597]|uniref:Glyoxalase/bleomycin resistance protein/dioxygenase n=1 Tax=Pseudooceanicola batsensis (strain ATCC BAA-863 / DSM 15984 / KCTC 12145 / HTCC2597) TaxID=252305 RepID=A3U245_PSEBH|nr:VOC family protein [Pseudooceanicola batsensis]EAQ01645.1 Glyoxalase/bleomycin resistance protein/dioxygenase [Pseudooceanicola batsensis HTCC2597]
MPDRKPKLVGVNHIALEVGDVAEALEFYGRIFDFDLRGKNEDDAGRITMAFIDMGDQFIALGQGREQGPDAHRHFGLVVDDRSTVADLARAAGADMVEGPFLDFRDPWGNRIEVVDYRDIQFTKADGVMAKLGVAPDKSDEARQQIRDKGLG